VANGSKGSDLVRMRTDRGLTQAEVGERIGVDRSQISRYEDGLSDPLLSGFRALRELYGVTADALLAAIDRAKRGGRGRRNGKAA
jgi:transcriptional regulator with XRE-family HTH domain